ncbi:hypothetical protein WMY93_021772 [Mugilogobius chulae]|uniref:Ribosomal RNA-processing protein 14/surfeit locus protein 6 C-terminal domain-containing protein n=1 Tax=Mugilogobius chulae TaxID=88201 RepID=A0AAW0NM44_9GOBI
MDLVSKDLYIQKLASRVFSQRPQLEPKNRRFGNLKGVAKDNAISKKKKKLKKKPTPKPQQNKTSANHVPQKTEAKTTPDQVKAKASPAKTNVKKDNVQFSGVDLLRKRLHEKIEESRGQGPPKDALSPEVQAKRAKRKLEREQERNSYCFNKVETVEEGYEDKMIKKQNKKKSLKGQITPLTGKNYKQLLSREKRKTQRKKKWDQRSENVVEKMQHRQDKRKKNILKRKHAKVEKKKDKARKRGRVLPEDLKKAGL